MKITATPLSLLLLLTLLLPPGPQSLSAQDYLSVEEQDPTLSIVLALQGIPTEFDVRNFKIRYTTQDAFGRPDTASGLISIPAGVSEPLPMTIYHHGTAGNRLAVPSVPGVQERILPAATASNGYLTVAPDYIGLGDSDGLHPYVHRDSEARAGRDLILAARRWFADQEIAQNGQLFTFGYSQGGHASMALQRDLNLNPDPDLRLTAAAHLSGPYSISEIMVNTLFTDELVTLPGYIVYAYISLNYVYQLFDDNGEIFVEPYVGLVDSFAGEDLSLDEFSFALGRRLEARGERIQDVLQDSILAQLRANDPTTSRTIAALRLQDTYEFTPAAPTLLAYCTRDEQVPFQNALLADSVFRARGAADVRLFNGGARDHGGCVFPAAQRTLAFFDEFAVRGPVTSLNGRPTPLHELRPAPNPLRAGQPLRLPGLDEGAAYPFVLHDATGRVLRRGALRGGRPLNTTGWPTGPLLLRLALPDGNFTARRIIVR